MDETIRQGLAYGDVLLVPRYSDIRSNADPAIRKMMTVPVKAMGS